MTYDNTGILLFHVSYHLPVFLIPYFVVTFPMDNKVKTLHPQLISRIEALIVEPNK